MMAEFQVSRPTVREALRVAESMGLIAVRPGDPAGPEVLSAPSLGITRLFYSLLKAGCASASELIELRILLESAAAAQLCTLPAKRRAPLESALKQMQAASNSEDFAELDALFHRTLIESGGNRLFLVIYQALLAPIQTMIEAGMQMDREHASAHVMRGHEQILAALKQGDARAARDAVRKHLLGFHKRHLTCP